MTHLEKFEALAAEVRDLKERDRLAHEGVTAAQLVWKDVNTKLTAANKALDDHINTWKNEATIRIKNIDTPEKKEG